MIVLSHRGFPSWDNEKNASLQRTDYFLTFVCEEAVKFLALKFKDGSFWPYSRSLRGYV